jgi:BirA family biotin operon repressor/biotin-[acetyl-CoA-carboxylase] ligase
MVLEFSATGVMGETPNLSIPRIEAAIATLEPALRGYFQISVQNTVSSTNQLLWERLEAGVQAGTVILASRQTSGRGQRGRHWLSEPGGLYLSLCTTPKLAAQDGPQLTIASAWGIARSLRDGQIPVSLKWLNDIFLQGRKLGGILTETRLRGDRITTAVIGVGVNWTNRVPDVGINLHQFWANHPESPSCSLEMLAARVLVGIEWGLYRLEQRGIEAIRSEYEQFLKRFP